MGAQGFSKFIRPQEARAGRISLRDLDILETILRYHFSPTSELLRLVGGNEDVTFRRLRRLWELGLINRWAFPGIRSHSEFHYYLDNRQALHLLFDAGRLHEIHPQMIADLRGHREKDYPGAVYAVSTCNSGFYSIP